MDAAVIAAQKQLCEQVGAVFMSTPDDLKVGISSNVNEGLVPINGVRVLPHGDASGWYIWAGEELSTDDEFFKPLHAGHLPEWCPEILKFLGLSPGWRFLVAGDHVDIWFDPEALTLK